jgi:hypothetical protein
MKWFLRTHARPGQPRRRFVPALESLEDRLAPAVTGQASPDLDPATATAIGPSNNPFVIFQANTPPVVLLPTQSVNPPPFPADLTAVNGQAVPPPAELVSAFAPLLASGAPPGLSGPAGPLFLLRDRPFIANLGISAFAPVTFVPPQPTPVRVVTAFAPSGSAEVSPTGEEAIPASPDGRSTPASNVPGTTRPPQGPGQPNPPGQNNPPGAGDRGGAARPAPGNVGPEQLAPSRQHPSGQVPAEMTPAPAPQRNAPAAPQGPHKPAGKQPADQPHHGVFDRLGPWVGGAAAAIGLATAGASPRRRASRGRRP